MQMTSSVGHLCRVCIAASMAHKRRILALKKRNHWDIPTPNAHRTFKVKHCKIIKHWHTERDTHKKHTIGRRNKTGESLGLLSSGWRRKIHPTSQRVLINHGLTGSNCLCWIPHLSPSGRSSMSDHGTAEKKSGVFSIRAWRNRFTPLDL